MTDRFKRRAFWVAVTFTLLGCVLLAPGCSDASEPTYEGSDVVLKVHFDEPERPVGRLIGWNVGSSSHYAPEGDPRHPEWRTPNLVEAVRRLHDVRAANGDRPYVRFSGLQIDGSLGKDGYHFWDFADPSAPVSEDDNVSPVEYMAIVSEVGADPAVTLNFGSGTADEAARYVTYLTGTDDQDPLVAARAADGQTAPWPADFFEVGNEIYSSTNTGFSDTGAYSYANPDAMNGGDPPWFGRPAKKVEDFAARAEEYVAAVHAVDPQARLYIPLTQSSWDGWGGPDVALPKLKALLEMPAVAGVVVHQYTSTDGTLGYGVAYEQNAWPLASADFYRPRYEALQRALAAMGRTVPLELAITEYHTVANVDPLNLVGPTPAAALGLADELMLFAEVGVSVAMQHMTLALGLDQDALSSSWHVPFALGGGALVNRPTYTVTKLVADHLYRELVRTEAVRMPTLRFEDIDQPFDYDLVHAASFVSADAQAASTLLLNRDLDAARVVSVVAPAGWSAASATRVAPADLWENVDDVRVTAEDAPFEQHGRELRLTLPPHSFTAVTWARAN